MMFCVKLEAKKKKQYLVFSTADSKSNIMDIHLKYQVVLNYKNILTYTVLYICVLYICVTHV